MKTSKYLVLLLLCTAVFSQSGYSWWPVENHESVSTSTGLNYRTTCWIFTCASFVCKDKSFNDCEKMNSCWKGAVVGSQVSSGWMRVNFDHCPGFFEAIETKEKCEKRSES